ncbi:MAG: hypothetical protein COV59_02220 [Candidatus Magasanikbacteria bacterium CG11_big_fil_rev_8_21_14_0_20_39_34]|uniref:Phosphoribosyl-ATP pyrophosphohydrolase n=1 Tax=Candidatus Magasanikbacteria bacterium CG11_big_fil_rev_8_21_14_0_20_39_34 TaxID=1974653 RepID=A0A2H0N507_9BACT|nr:MAG: hypothetical protein COV59_02220 [Candidatus Magasanikbacteria bacterium CG11_big_fil_rev_8_21_14_0_20_39_34]
MDKQIELVRKFHEKFHQPVADSPTLIPEDRSQNRYSLMKSEVEEYLEGVKNGDLENIAKELADILFTVYGTIVEHGLQGKMDEIFDEVTKSNMSKDYHKYKMIKGESYREADLSKFF